MTQTEISYAKTWRLRRAMTEKKRALAHCRAINFRGLARLTAEGLERDLRLIRAELDRRKLAA